jgi:hypothetical protein
MIPGPAIHLLDPFFVIFFEGLMGLGWLVGGRQFIALGVGMRIVPGGFSCGW